MLCRWFYEAEPFILRRLDDFGVSIVLDYPVREQGTLRG
jgi:hypothetical protein